MKKRIDALDDDGARLRHAIDIEAGRHALAATRLARPATVGIYSAVDLFATYAGRAADLAPWLKDAAIKIRSDNSGVTIRGKVSDPKVKSRASDVVRGVPGVRSVRNELGLKG